MHEEGLPHQPVEIGDIIYSMNGKRIYTVSEYREAKETDGEKVTAGILRFTESGYEFVEAEIDSALGQNWFMALTEEQE